MPIELVNLITNLGMGGLFFYLYWDERKLRQAQDDKHDLEIKQLHEQRIQDLKLIYHMPTDLIADYTMPSKAA
jgi:hypothetical protein